jgi:hypothetical protein
MHQIGYIVIESSTRLHMDFSLEGSLIYHISGFLVANAIFLRSELGYLNSKARLMKDFFLDIHHVARIIEFIINLVELLKKPMMLSLMKPMGHMKSKTILMM